MRTVYSTIAHSTIAHSTIALTLALFGAACNVHQSPTAEDAARGPSAAPVAEPTESAPETTESPPTTFVARFDATLGELPEGLFVTTDAAFVGFAPSSQIVRVALDTGATAPFARLPAPVPNKGFMTGIAQSAAGDLFVGLASFTPEVQPGIYRVDRAYGTTTLFAKHAELPFPNALAFDESGSLFVTDSGTGSVFRINPTGEAERWASGDLLAGKKYSCGAGLGPGFDIGANGLVVERDAVYVVNTDKATLVKLPRLPSGKAAEPSIAAGPDCENLGGADGLSRAPDGSFIVAINRQDKLVRVRVGGETTPIATGAPLDFPASLAFRGSDLYVTNFALYNARDGKPAAAGLLKLTP